MFPVANLRQILFILTNAICAVVFAIAYPETRGKRYLPTDFMSWF